MFRVAWFQFLLLSPAGHFCVNVTFLSPACPLEGWLKEGMHVDIQGNVPVVKGWGSGVFLCILIDLLVHTVLLIEGS